MIDNNSKNSKALNDVIAERIRQIKEEGHTIEHDDEINAEAQLARAAACYALPSSRFTEPPKHWPWSAEQWKPDCHRRNLVKAGALILAELERMDRLDGDETA